jgi:hypothetical protein
MHIGCLQILYGTILVLNITNMVKGRFFETMQLLNATEENYLERNIDSGYRREEEVFCHCRELNCYSSVVQPLASPAHVDKVLRQSMSVLLFR